MLSEYQGKALTVLGPVEPSALGRVMMHEHLHSDCYDWEKEELIIEEHPITEERRQLLLREAIPYMKQWPDYGCFSYVDVTPAPWRAWPSMYVETAELTGLHIILCTGFYRELEDGRYWVKKQEDRIWPFVTNAPVEELAEFCAREIVEGIHGTDVHAGAIKLGTSQPEMTPTEIKAFRAGARAQKATGVHITTHCTEIGAESSQLRVLDEEGVDLSRVVIGHTAAHLMDPDCRKVCLEWMRRGANFLPTNLGLWGDGENWRPLIEAIHDIFDAGHGDKITFGTDWAFVSESGAFGPCDLIPPPHGPHPRGRGANHADKPATGDPDQMKLYYHGSSKVVRDCGNPCLEQLSHCNSTTAGVVKGTRNYQHFIPIALHQTLFYQIPSPRGEGLE